ncbi:MAG: MBL fold metallo-hydrolase [Dehalococcoidia bacterium]|nr:MBL fold metallo-hydrolase [Dehalococcoidia bacterium]
MQLPTAHIGDVTIDRVEELLIPTSPRWLLPDHETPFDLLGAAEPWLRPFMTEEGRLLQSIHTYVVRTPETLILVDTGIGNDKDRTGGIEGFHMRGGPFLEDLRAAGVDPEAVEVVVMTHMHGDHVGWNTRLVDGQWTPTFPNARYLFVRPEWEHWSAEAANNEATRRLVEDSLRPVLEAGCVDLVDADHRIDAYTRLEASHGHSPGHVTFVVDGRGEGGAGAQPTEGAPTRAAFLGDIMHSPIQAAAPDTRAALDRDPAPAMAARRAFLERYAETGTLVLGAHWSPPCAGYVRRDGDVYRIEAWRGV